MAFRMRTGAITAGVIFGLAASQNLGATCSGSTIAYTLAGQFGKTPVSGEDKLKLEGGPFNIVLYVCSTLTPTTSGTNYASYYPVRLTGTVKSALIEQAYSIPPTQTTLTLANPTSGADIVTTQGTVIVYGSTINILGVVALPAGTLTSPSLGTFSSVSVITAQSAFQYSQGTESTTLAVRGTAVATVYTGTGGPDRPLLYSGSVQVITAHADGTQSMRSIEASPVDLGAASDKVMLQFYASGIRDASLVRVQIAGQDVPLIYFGAAGHFDGLDEVTVEVPRSLAGMHDADVVLTADGQTASPVRIHIQ
jgi:hypothetical protein